MIYNVKTVRKQVFGLSLSEANFSVRKFDQGFEAQSRLELVAKTVVNGYNCSVENGLNDDLRAITKSIKPELGGFFHEGIGMGLFVLDLFSLPRKTRFYDYILEAERKHEYMSYIGAGLACGVFGVSVEKVISKGDPMSSYLVIDGFGFYYAMFKTSKGIKEGYVPKSIQKSSFYQERYDNGVGRAIWFYNSGEPDRIAKTVKSFPENRRAAIWSGVGLASTYAGGVSNDKIKNLVDKSAGYRWSLAQGSILAAHTRKLAETPIYNQDAVKIITGQSADQCHEKAMEMRLLCEGKREVNGMPSFQYMVTSLKEWAQKENKKNE